MTKPSPMDGVLHDIRAENQDTVVRSGVVLRVDLDPDAHVVEHRLAPASAVEHALQRVLCLPFPDRPPPWDVHVLSGHRDDEYTLFFRASRTDFWRRAGRTPHTRRCFRWASVPTNALLATGHACDATANEVYLAAYATAFLCWAPFHALACGTGPRGDRPGQHPAPRGAEDSGPPRCRGPRHAAGRHDQHRTARRRRSPRHGPGAVAVGAARARGADPAHADAAALPDVAGPADSSQGDHGGFPRRRAAPRELDGDPVLSMAPLMPLSESFPRTAVLLSYQDTATICAVSDPALPGMDTLHERRRRVVEDMAGEVFGRRGTKGVKL